MGFAGRSANPLYLFFVRLNYRGWGRALPAILGESPSEHQAKNSERVDKSPSRSRVPLHGESGASKTRSSLGGRPDGPRSSTVLKGPPRGGGSCRSPSSSDRHPVAQNRHGHPQEKPRDHRPDGARKGWWRALLNEPEDPRGVVYKNPADDGTWRPRSRVEKKNIAVPSRMGGSSATRSRAFCSAARPRNRGSSSRLTKNRAAVSRACEGQRRPAVGEQPAQREVKTHARTRQNKKTTKKHRPLCHPNPHAGNSKNRFPSATP